MQLNYFCQGVMPRGCKIAKKSKAATGFWLLFTVVFYNEKGAVTYVTFWRQRQELVLDKRKSTLNAQLNSYK